METAETRGQGVGVAGVRQGGPAAKMGIRRYDVIVSIDGAQIRNRSDLEEILIKRQAGDKVKVGVLRDDKTLELEAELVTFESLMKKK
ncbi:MAG: PDZ domain-containing protein [Verrucomicrobiaceae bacterium]|nr:MAG: PDZ domain-containing protein [Verrucomicrobiaceae bacterium]